MINAGWGQMLQYLSGAMDDMSKTKRGEKEKLAAKALEEQRNKEAIARWAAEQEERKSEFSQTNSRLDEGQKFQEGMAVLPNLPSDTNLPDLDPKLKEFLVSKGLLKTQDTLPSTSSVGGGAGTDLGGMTSTQSPGVSQTIRPATNVENIENARLRLAQDAAGREATTSKLQNQVLQKQLDEPTKMEYMKAERALILSGEKELAQLASKLRQGETMSPVEAATTMRAALSSKTYQDDPDSMKGFIDNLQKIIETDPRMRPTPQPPGQGAGPLLDNTIPPPPVVGVPPGIKKPGMMENIGAWLAQPGRCPKGTHPGFSEGRSTCVPD
jgi:hypothetical protein